MRRRPERSPTLLRERMIDRQIKNRGIRDDAVLSALLAVLRKRFDRPWVGVQVMLEHGMALADVEPAIRETVEAELDHLSDFRAELGRGEFAVC